MLPNFLIIGAMKAGTSSLWHYLRAHPEVYLPSVKELNFFERNWSRGWCWYESQFQVDKEGVRAYGEASPNYTKYPAFSGVAEKIAAALPKVKLVYVVRDPIERIRSMYVHMICEGLETRSFDEVMNNLSDNHYVQLSLYNFQLAQYLAHFDKRQILVIASEDLRDNRLETLKRVFRFIGVNDGFDSAGFANMFYKSTELRQTKSIAKLLHKLPFHDRILQRSPGSVRTLYRNLTTSSVSRPLISEDLRKRLVKVIRPDVEELRKLVGQRLDFWCV